jgi:predicted ABC-type transport system involved in lysophospholipase L1 biosynthesis ATPase subunit
MTGSASTPAVQIAGVLKRYGGLRPLRLRALTVQAGERVAIAGLDAAAAEILVGLLTGATLPDEGEIRIDGRATADIRNEAEWIASLDRFGIVSPRAVLLSGATVRQNLAMPFTLSIDPLPDAIAERAERLAAEVGLASDLLDLPAGPAPPEAIVRVHLARALAIDPRVLVLEHPTVTLGAEAAPGLAADVARVATARHLAVIAVTEDDRFADALGGRRVRLDAATGALAPARGWRRWFR